MKKYMIIVMAVVVMFTLMITGCNKNDRFNNYELCLNTGRDRGLITWDVHEYYGRNNDIRANIDRDWYLNHNRVVTEIRNNEGVYSFKTMYIAE